MISATTPDPPIRRPASATLAIPLFCLLAALFSSGMAYREFARPRLLLTVEPAERAEITSADDLATPVSFRLQNLGRETVQIMSLESSCTCTITQLEPKTIPPGKSSELLVSINPQNLRWPFSSVVTVVYRQQGSSHLYRKVLEVIGKS